MSSGNLFSFFLPGCEEEGEWGLVVGTYLSLSGKGRGGHLFEAGLLLTVSASRMGAYLRWALIRGWALIQINTVRMRELLHVGCLLATG